MSANPQASSADRQDDARATVPDAVEHIARSTVAVAAQRGISTGFAWRDGWLVASAAAVWRSRQWQVILPGGELVEARLQGTDPSTDIALLGVPGTPLPLVERAAAPPRVGSFVFAVGREDGGRVHASFGRVGSVGGEWRTWRGGRVERYVRLDGGLYPGLAGAPVATAEGHVVGMASASLSRHHGVVLPLETIDRVAEVLLAHGRVARGYLGVAVQPARARVGDQGVDGVLVSSVADDAPAARAGLLVGDVVTAVDGAAVHDPASLREQLERLPAGRSARLAVVRGGGRVEVDVALGEPPGRQCR